MALVISVQAAVDPRQGLFLQPSPGTHDKAMSIASLDDRNGISGAISAHPASVWSLR
jgi:hypothetical protein